MFITGIPQAIADKRGDGIPRGIASVMPTIIPLENNPVPDQSYNNAAPEVSKAMKKYLQRKADNGGIPL